MGKRQIFVDGSTLRRRVLRLTGVAVALVCVGYLLMLAAALSGALQADTGRPLPRTVEAPQDSQGSPPDSGRGDPRPADARRGGTAW